MSDVIEVGGVVERNYREAVGKSPAREDIGEQDNELGYKQRGYNYKVVGTGQFPLLNFAVRFAGGNRAHTVKYAHLTDQIFNAADENAGGQNSITLLVQNVMRITICGLNLWTLDDHLRTQQVIELGAVDEVTAAAALKTKPGVPVITGIKLEHGMMDMQHGLWMPGQGHFDEAKQCWVSSRVADYR